MNMKYSRMGIKQVAQDFPYVLKIINGEFVPEGDAGKFLTAYFNRLGGTDALSQIDYLNERRAELKKYKEESAADYKKYSSLYIKIFFMVGVLIAVLLA